MVSKTGQSNNKKLNSHMAKPEITFKKKVKRHFGPCHVLITHNVGQWPGPLIQNFLNAEAFKTSKVCASCPSEFCLSFYRVDTIEGL